jgi:hypothetical protein
MATDVPPTPQAVDLSGLPEPVVRDVQRLVQALRERVSAGAAPSDAFEAARRETWPPLFVSRPQPSPEEFDRLLDEFSSGPPGKVLPPDFSRADIYDDHD